MFTGELKTKEQAKLMEHWYHLSLVVTTTHPKRAIRALMSTYRDVDVYLDDKLGVSLKSRDEHDIRSLYAEAKKGGFKCSFNITTYYDRDDALSGGLGCFYLGPSNFDFRAALPKDAFDFSGACPRCGLGATQVKPHLLGRPSIHSKPNFNTSVGRARPPGLFMRAEIGREVIEATGQPNCMRHPMTRKGEVVMEWMEAVPCATMPPLSRSSEGVLWARTFTLSSTGDPPKKVPPCTECGRVPWAEAQEQPTRLVYPRAAIEAAQKHGVVSMWEPRDIFPEFDAKKRAFKDYWGWPELLFSRAAIRVMLKYTQREHIRDSAGFQPVFSE